MTIHFFPLGIPFSSSYANTCVLTQATTPAGFPVTASLAEYISTYVGPAGPLYETVGPNGVQLV